MTCDRSSYDSRAKPQSPSLTTELLGKELAAMRDQPNGKISGKIDSGQGDDLAMAFMMALYWGRCCAALNV